MRLARSNSNRGWRLAAISIAVTISGCAGAAASASIPMRNGMPLPDRARALIEHCPELACTTAEVPGCGFRADIAEGGETVRADIECARDGAVTACVERRSPVGGENTSIESQHLEFRCGGDPLSCVATGGNAVSVARLVSDAPRDGVLTCHSKRRTRPTPAPHSIPGPDTV